MDHVQQDWPGVAKQLAINHQFRRRKEMKTMRKFGTNAEICPLADSDLDSVSGGTTNGTINAFLGKPLPFNHQGPILDPPFPYPIKVGPSVPVTAG